MIDLERPGSWYTKLSITVQTYVPYAARSAGYVLGAIAFARIPQATKYFSENYETKGESVVLRMDWIQDAI